MVARGRVVRGFYLFRVQFPAAHEVRLQKDVLLDPDWVPVRAEQVPARGRREQEGDFRVRASKTSAKDDRLREEAGPTLTLLLRSQVQQENVALDPPGREGVDAGELGAVGGGAANLVHGRVEIVGGRRHDPPREPREDEGGGGAKEEE